MTILPLLDRELRRRARGAAVYGIRFGAALAGFFVCLSTMTMSYGFSANVSQKGAMAFQGLVATAFVLCCFSGFLTVDQISRERREGTLGLLFLTRVRVLDVLVGNFGAAGIASLCALAAFVPVLIVPILSGGVTGGEAVRKVLALFATMILSLSIGLWASAGAREWRASARAAGLMLILCILGPMLGDLPGPLRALKAADDVSYNASARSFWSSIILVQVESWALMLWAIIRLRLAVRDDDETAAQTVRPAGDVDEPPIFELASYKFTRHKYKPLTDDDAPMDWLLRRQKDAAAVVWAGPLFELFLTFGVRFLPSSATRTFYSYQGIYLAVSIVQGCLFAWVASRFFIEARRTGELELLMTTPEGARTIVVNQWKWLKKVFRWPALVMVAALGIGQATAFIQTKKMVLPTMYLPFYITSLVFYSVNTVMGIGALLWVGMWFGWSQRTQSRAIVWIVVLTKGLPYIASFLLSFVIIRIASPMGYPRFYWYSRLTWTISPIVTLLYYLWLIRWAKRQFGTALLPSSLGAESSMDYRTLYAADT